MITSTKLILIWRSSQVNTQGFQSIQIQIGPRDLDQVRRSQQTVQINLIEQIKL